MSHTAGITLLRTFEHTRTEHQLRPGEGFAPDYTPVADRITSMDAPRTPQLATPPGWSARAKCLNRWDEYDDHRPDRTDESMAAKARRMCFGCPVISECLEAAMEMENTDTRSYRPDRRHGIRGGLTPSGRASLQRERDEAEDGAVA